MIDRAVFGMPGARGVLVRVSALIFLRALAVVGQAAGLAFAITLIWRGEPLPSVVGWIALFFLCFVIRQVLVAVQDRMLERYVRTQAVELRRDLLRAVFREGPALASSEGSAALTAAVIEGVEHVESYIALIIPKTLAVAIVPLVLLLAMLPLDWVSCLIALVCFPFIILYMVMIGHTAQDDAAKRHDAFERMSNHFIDSVRGVDTLKAFGLSRGFGDRIFGVSEKFREATMKTLRIATLSSAVLDTFSTLALAAVAIMLGFRLVDGSLEFLPALMVLIMVPEYFRPIREFASDYHASLDGKTSLAQITRLIDDPGVCEEPAVPASSPSESCGEMSCASGGICLARRVHPCDLRMCRMRMASSKRSMACRFTSRDLLKWASSARAGRGSRRCSPSSAAYAHLARGAVLVDGEVNDVAAQRLARPRRPHPPRPLLVSCDAARKHRVLPS